MGLQNSQIMICKNIRLDKSYKDVLSYTENQMLTLCQQNAVASANNYSFIRGERGYIKTSFNYNDALKCNYMAFQNSDYSNKWFFAFIDDVIYDNDGTARIRYTVDEFSTWYDYWDAEPCFVVREHVGDDTVGLHTIPEGLECGEYVIGSSGSIGASSYFQYTRFKVVIGTSWIPSGPTFYTDNRRIGNVFSGTYYFVFYDYSDAAKFILAYASEGHVNDIQCLYMIPNVLAAVTSETVWNQGDLGGQTGIRFIYLHGSTGAINIDTNITISMPTTFDTYTPKNNKVLCYPYNCLTMTNNSGTMAEYHYEDFVNNTPVFNLVGLQTPSCPMFIYPVNYKKNTTSKSGYAWGIPLAKVPQGSWNADMYTNWMTQNGVNILGMKVDAPTSHAIMGSLQALSGAALGGYDTIGTGLANMFGAVQESYRASMIPNQIGGQTTVGDVTFAYDKLAPTWYKMRIREENARVIDDWFTRFGYKINRVKLPNQIGRRYWNYVQIGSSENIGYSPSTSSRSVPAASMEIINTIYRNGTTIWHNHANIGNYSLDNVIV
ncbi:hypothetical protein [Fusobacterium ulcerans]|uniref:hypothetical protein n=1 Tax=Fusobacterium ulcerans TaxID=861 RepID=UPI002E782628|nr:hypothetical protein [Fusobacterium ulcerans]MEE0137743.1 hypothetical protein [Fusobacterium ulcerans]